MFDSSEMLNNIEFENEPPTFDQIPDYVMDHFCRQLTAAVKKYKAEQEEIRRKQIEQEKRDARNARRRELYRRQKEARAAQRTADSEQWTDCVGGKNVPRLLEQSRHG